MVESADLGELDLGTKTVDVEELMTAKQNPDWDEHDYRHAEELAEGEDPLTVAERLALGNCPRCGINVCQPRFESPSHTSRATGVLAFGIRVIEGQIPCPVCPEVLIIRAGKIEGRLR